MHFDLVAQAWIHLKMIIVFTEAVLRYGPPPDFYTVVFGSRSGALDSNALHKRLGQALDGVLGGGDDFELVDEDGGSESYHSYVSLSIKA